MFFFLIDFIIITLNKKILKYLISRNFSQKK